MDIYIAAASEERQAAKEMKARIEAAGYTVTSRWIELENFSSADTKYLMSWAENDLLDVFKADMVVLLNPAEFKNKGTGGRHVEVGYALAYGKPVILCGEKSNIFHWHPNVHHLRYPNDIIDAIIEWAPHSRTQ